MILILGVGPAMGWLVNLGSVDLRAKVKCYLSA